MTIQDGLFYGFAAVTLLSALLMIFVSNPIYSSFFLALVMCALGGLFFILDASFVAAAQIVVYAGAVMVLFVMVMMIFDLKREPKEFAHYSPLTFIKILFVGALCGVLCAVGWMASEKSALPILEQSATQVMIKNIFIAPAGKSTNAQELKDEVVEITKNPQDGREIFKDYSDTQKLSLKLFSKFAFVFEALSILLLVAIVGTVALAKSKGGTHHGATRR